MSSRSITMQRLPFSIFSEVLLSDNMAQVTVGVLIEERHENRSQETTDGFQVKLLSDSELQKQLLFYGVEPGPVLPSTRTLYENKLLELMNSSPQTPRGQTNETEDLDRYSETEEEKTKETSTAVVLETKDFKVTAACASGYDKASHTEVSERHKKLLSPDTDYSLAKIVAELEQILPEDKLAAHLMHGQKQSGGSSPQPTRRKTIADTPGGTAGKDDGQGETWFPAPQSPVGISSRQRAAKESGQSTKETVETVRVEKEKLKLEKEKFRSEVAREDAHQGLIPMPVRIAIFTIFIFVLFVYVTMETNPANPFLQFIMGRGL
ncbi:PREDICTED: LEM domain-containing protein 1 isoform X3 [Gavialis gangeticus]|uniref:LEM domain-containing protein 1 isoform X3 n=1 Tax=Gavialis gangeticus TaxID=94835 RepID=UPI00092FC3EE|nr:PREDICTED: LEM domain-containing protein 1 isoform X3 [Gavialis gangeticus]